MTCAETPKRRAMSCSQRVDSSNGERIRISTRPVSFAYEIKRETEDLEVFSSRAMASIVRSCM